eukprot:TRINITY_DN26889_c0_g5_i1.p1 TRINITY_DN26889_c0_g5~~TRINITY_DN26889_c0_g5_i1.p1  ORF type:complete len:589 (+),score=114.03 TRINITY_DN26889_c0_g5_i1:103-1869(+)
MRAVAAWRAATSSASSARADLARPAAPAVTVECAATEGAESGSLSPARSARRGSAGQAATAASAAATQSSPRWSRAEQPASQARMSEAGATATSTGACPGCGCSTRPGHGDSEMRGTGAIAPAWTAVVRRVQAEENAREAAIAELSACLREEVETLNARIQAVKASVEVAAELAATGSSRELDSRQDDLFYSRSFVTMPEGMRELGVRCDELSAAQAQMTKDHEKAMKGLEENLMAAIRSSGAEVKNVAANVATLESEIERRLQGLEETQRKLADTIGDLTQRRGVELGDPLGNLTTDISSVRGPPNGGLASEGSCTTLQLFARSGYSTRTPSPLQSARDFCLPVPASMNEPGCSTTASASASASAPPGARGSAQSTGCSASAAAAAAAAAASAAGAWASGGCGGPQAFVALGAAPLSGSPGVSSRGALSPPSSSPARQVRQNQSDATFTALIRGCARQAASSSGVAPQQQGMPLSVPASPMAANRHVSPQAAMSRMAASSSPRLPPPWALHQCMSPVAVASVLPVSPQASGRAVRVLSPPPQSSEHRRSPVHERRGNSAAAGRASVPPCLARYQQAAPALPGSRRVP